MFIKPIEDYINVFKISYPAEGDLYNLQILNNNKADKIIILSETSSLSEPVSNYLMDTREFLVTKIYDLFLKKKNVPPEKIIWIEKYHEESYRGKKNKKLVGQYLKFNWDKDSEKFNFLVEEALDHETFSRILNDI